jgi:hypothetical protein
MWVEMSVWEAFVKIDYINFRAHSKRVIVYNLLSFVVLFGEEEERLQVCRKKEL